MLIELLPQLKASLNNASVTIVLDKNGYEELFNKMRGALLEKSSNECSFMDINFKLED